ncbi:MAG: hypothetical protein NVS4B6_30040 [Mycobacterium sp.]
MRGVEVGAGAGAILAVVGILGTAPPAHATDYGIALNGTYRATSIGDWAQSSEGPFGAGGARVYRDQPSKVETWTVSSDCVSPIECIGAVRSDAGWTAALKFNGDFWLVDRDIPDWEPCPDGTAAPGHQNFGLWGWENSTGHRNNKFRDLIVGAETTVAPSGACGLSKPLVIELPVRLERLS